MNEPAPKSQMLRVPTALIPAVRELSRLHREGHTTVLLQSLQDVIAEIDSNFDSNLIPTNTDTKHLEEKLDRLETQLKSEREKLTTAEFIAYTRNRDPRSFGWEYRSDGLYHPIGQ